MMTVYNRATRLSLLVTLASLGIMVFAGLGMIALGASGVLDEKVEVVSSEQAEVTPVELIAVGSSTFALYEFSPRSRPEMTCFILRGSAAFGGMHCWVEK